MGVYITHTFALMSVNVTLGVFVDQSPPRMLRQALSWTPELADSTSLASQLVPRILSLKVCVCVDFILPLLYTRRSTSTCLQQIEYC